MNRKKIKIALTSLCLLSLSQFGYKVEAGSRNVIDVYRQIVEYGAIVESKGEPAQMRYSATAGEYRYYQYEGYWSGSEYFRPKDLKYDTLKSQSFNSSHTAKVKFWGNSDLSANFRTYTSADNSNWREIWNAGNVRGNPVTLTANLTPSNFGTVRYIRGKLDTYSSTYGATINELELKVTQTDNTAPYGNPPKIISSNDNSFTVQVTGVGDSISGISTVKFAVWTSSGGQDDIKWYNATNNGNGTWSYTVNRSSHGNQLGEYVVHAYAYDATWAGNSKNLGEVKHNFADKVPPTVSHSINPTGWTNGNVTINITSSDNFSGVSHIIRPDGSRVNGSTTSYAVSSNGSYTFKVYDKQNNVTNHTVNISNIDKTAPSGNAWVENVSITGFDVVVNNLSDSQSGVNRVEICAWRDGWDVDGRWQTDYRSSGTSRFRVNTSDYGNKSGTYYIDVRVFDNVGNGGTPIKHLQANIPYPTVHSSPIAITNHEYQNGNTYWVKGGDQFTAKVFGYSTPESPRYKINREYLVARNESATNFNTEKTFGAVIPESLPIGNTHSETWLVDSTFNTSLKFGSGSYSVRTSNTWADTYFNMILDGNESVKLSPVVRIQSDGKLIDSDWHASSVIVKSDSDAPNITFSQSPNVGSNWTNKDVTVEINVSDSRSGVNNWTVRKKVDNGTWTNLANNTTSVLLNTTGTHTIEVSARDNVGNVRTSSIVVKIDKIAPTISNIPTVKEYLDMTTFTINASDTGGSNMKSLVLYKNGVEVQRGVSSITHFENVNGTHTFKIVAQDNAGNVTEKTFSITILEDKITLITTPKNPSNLIKLDWTHQNRVNKSYTVYQKRAGESSFKPVPGTGDTFKNITLDNTYASDVNAPNTPNVKFIEETDTYVTFEIFEPTDNATTYDFYVVSKDNYGKLTQSNTATDSVITGIKGYTYVVDNNPNTIPDNTVDVLVGTKTINLPITNNNNHYLHIAAVDKAGNVSTPNHVLVWEAVENNWLNQEIARQMGKDYKDLRISDYRNLEVLTLRNKGISGPVPKDITKAINILEIDLYKNNITDISNISNLPKLEYLQLGNNKINDISALQNLDSLTDLNIFNNQVSDISIVSQMPNLERLYLHKNNITDISAVANLTKLQELYIELNYIDVNDAKTAEILDRFENNGCYVVRLPQNIVRSESEAVVEMDLGSTYSPKVNMGLSNDMIRFTNKSSILGATEYNFISSNTNVIQVKNNKLVAVGTGEAIIRITHSKFNNISTTSFKVIVTDESIVDSSNSDDSNVETTEPNEDNLTTENEKDNENINIDSDSETNNNQQENNNEESNDTQSIKEDLNTNDEIPVTEDSL